MVGESPGGFPHLREDAGLNEMVGHRMPSPPVARKFLNGLHEDANTEAARQQRTATVDQNATILESQNREALRT